MQLFDFQHLHIVAALGLILPILELKRSTLNMMASTLVTLIMEPDLVLFARHHHHHHTVFFIGPESDHWLCLSVTHSLTNSLTDYSDCRLVNLIDVSLACEYDNSKLVEVVDDEKQFTP